MKNRQTRIIIGILVGLILFSSSIALLMYSKQNNLSEYVEGHVEVYVSAKHLYKGDLINPEDIEKAFLPKSYLLFAPLTKSEIIGRYATVEIFKKEPLRKEKISLSKPVLNKTIVQKVAKVAPKVEKIDYVKRDTITVSLSIFKNIDGSLKKGDYIDIVSVRARKNKKETQKYDTKYVALKVKINSFVSNFKRVKKYVVSTKNGVTVSDSVVLEMNPDEIKNFLSVYYTTQELNAKRVFNSKTNAGHLWMVKRSSVSEDKNDKIKKRMLVDHVQTVYKRKKSAPKVRISYED